MSFFARLINRVSEITGQLTAWLVVLLVCITFYDVLMRYLFNNGSVGLQELEWHLFSLIILLGAAYTLKHREHVRVDLFYGSKRFQEHHRDYVDLAGNLLFLLPFCLLIIFSSSSFIDIAYHAGERSPDPGGLPYRWLLKSMIPLGFLLLALQAIADSIEIVGRLKPTRQSAADNSTGDQ